MNKIIAVIILSIVCSSVFAGESTRKRDGSLKTRIANAEFVLPAWGK